LRKVRRKTSRIGWGRRKGLNAHNLKMLSTISGRQRLKGARVVGFASKKDRTKFSQGG